jgi:HAD superfamily hydrolase (TIGR01549 family)
MRRMSYGRANTHAFPAAHQSHDDWLFADWQLSTVIGTEGMVSLVNGRAVRCLLFDLGSTLWTRCEETASLAEEQAKARAAGVFRQAVGDRMCAGMDAAALGKLLKKTIGKQRRAEARQHPGYEPDCVLATLRALHQLGLADADRALAAALFEALRVRIPASRVLFADTLSTLAALKGRSYLLGVVTNRHYGGPLFRDDVAAMGLLDYFAYEHMAISADVGVCKPHPAIFTHALTSLHVAPEEAAMVGDKLDADMAGARSLNMLSIWKAADEHSAEEERALAEIKPDREIAQLRQLLEIF